MTLKLFLSHSTCDTYIAQAIRRIINDAFEGHVDIYLAVDEVAGGTRWKQELIDTLDQSDGILSIITPESISSPWIYVEWSPFWLNGKKIYTLISEKIFVKDLIDPMRDVQCTNMTDTAQVRRFFSRLRDDSGAEFPVPYDWVSRFVSEVIASQTRQQQERFDVYKEQLSCLPFSDTDRLEIADYFLAKADYDTFLQIINRVRSDDQKLELAIRMLHHENEDLISRVLETISAADRLTLFALSLIDKGLSDSKLFKFVLENLSRRNQPELRKVVIHLIEVNLEDTDIFEFGISLITSMPEYRKVMIHFIYNNRYSEEIFDEMVAKCGRLNKAELRKVGQEFIHNDLLGNPQFLKIVFFLFDNSPTQATILMEEVLKRNSEFYLDLWNRIKNKRFRIDPEIFAKLENRDFPTY